MQNPSLLFLHMQSVEVMSVWSLEITIYFMRHLKVSLLKSSSLSALWGIYGGPGAFLSWWKGRKGKPPSCALLVSVRLLFLHCSLGINLVFLNREQVPHRQKLQGQQSLADWFEGNNCIGFLSCRLWQWLEKSLLSSAEDGLVSKSCHGSSWSCGLLCFLPFPFFLPYYT